VDERGKLIHHFPFTVVFECGHKMIDPERCARVRLRSDRFIQLKSLRSVFLARNKRDLVAATEMPANSEISFKELSLE
jgi:hypothetical protein